MKKTSLTSKIISVVASVAMIFGLCPGLAYAASSSSANSVDAASSSAISPTSPSSEVSNAGNQDTGDAATQDISMKSGAQSASLADEGGSVLNDAASILASGQCGDNLSWTLNQNGVLTIEGTGPMANCSPEKKASWSAYASSIKTVIIGEGVTSIGDYAFYGCSTLAKVEMPSGVISIGASAFEGCTSLVSIALPSGMLSIGESAFSGCSSLVKVNIPEGVTTIESSAFRECTSLTTLKLPSSIVSIGQSAFYDCSSLVGIEIPDGVMSIEYEAFYGCSSLIKIELPVGVVTIGAAAFGNCSALTSIDIPRMLASIGDYAFRGCERLNTVVFAGNAPEISDNAFSLLDLTAYYREGDTTWTASKLSNYGGALAWVSYTECPKTDISNAVVDSIDNHAYTGYEITPLPTVTLDGETLTLGIDYLITYENNVNAGTATLTITGCGQYTGSKTVTFTIDPVDISSAFVMPLFSHTYTGSEITPTPIVMFNLQKLEADTDFIATYENNINVGTATITMTGTGNFTGETSATFRIVKARVMVPSAKTDLIYNGQEQTGVELPEGAPYTLSGNTATNPGSYTATAVLNDKDNYAWNLFISTSDDQEIEWEISKGDISDAVVSPIENQTYTGEALTPAVEVTLNGVKLVKDVDYTVEYSDNVDAGSAYVTLTGIGYYEGEKVASFTIDKAEGDASFARSIVVKSTEDSSFINELTATPGGIALYTSSDKSVATVNFLTGRVTLVGEGTATITTTVTWLKNYNPCTITYQLIVTDTEPTFTVADIADQTYNGSQITPQVYVTNAEGTTLTENVDYTLQYGENLHAGIGNVVVTGIGSYAGIVEKDFTINTIKVDVPVAKTGLAYTGKEQTGVELPYGAPYTLSGNTGTEVASYTATAVLNDTKNYQWNLENPTSDNQEIAWKIVKAEGQASFENATVLKKCGDNPFTNPLETNSGGSVLYFSSDYSVASVNITSGEVTIKGNGKATITATVMYTKNYTMCSASYTVMVSNASVSYTTHVQNIGWQDYVSDGTMAGTSGMEYRLEGIKIKLSNIDGLDGGIKYRTHVQNIGWQDYVSDDEMSGTTGMEYRLEAIQIELTEDVAEAYDVYYRVHAQNIGWMGWAKNGEEAGTAGYEYRLEAIQIVLVEKGGDAPGNVGGIKSNVDYAFNSKTDGPSNPYRNEQVSYNTHVQNIGWQDWSKMGYTAGTSGLAYRLEGIHIELGGDAANLNGSIKYRTHVQNEGWQDYVADGEMSGTSGMSYRLEAIQIKLTDEVLENYDVYYRVHAQNIGWMGWAKNDEKAGTAGMSYRLEAIQIVLVEKGGEAPAKDYGGVVSETDDAFREDK